MWSNAVEHTLKIVSMFLGSVLGRWDLNFVGLKHKVYFEIQQKYTKMFWLLVISKHFASI